MSTFFADYPVTGGVTSINGETGAITLIGAGGITITPAGQNITITGTGGTVTSVGLSLPASLFTVSGSPVTSSGTLTGTLITQTANTVFSGPTTGSAAMPTFRALVSADIPSLSAIYVTQSEVGQPNGVASLDSGGKVPVAQLPSTIMEYIGNWNPSTNTPTLSDGTGTNGNVYYVTTAFPGPIAGLNNASMVNFQIGDIVIYSSALGQWQLTTPAAGVQSVNGAQGVVTVNAISQLTGDITAGPASGSQSKVASLVATSNSTLITLSALSLPTSQLSGSISLTTQVSGILPVSHGGTGVSSVTTTPGATAWAGWDANDNMSANNFLEGYTSTVTAGGTTTLVAASMGQQYFTGTMTQTVVLPAVSTLTIGQCFLINNLSTSNVTIETSDLTPYAVMASNQYAIVTCVSNSGTGIASWSIQRWLVGASVTVPTGFGGTGQNGALNSQGVIFANTTTMMASTAQERQWHISWWEWFSSTGFPCLGIRRYP